MKLLLQQYKSKEAINKDLSVNLSLSSTQKEIAVEDINVIIDEFEQFSMERRLNFKYFLHGKLELLKDSGYGFSPYLNDNTITDFTPDNWKLSFVYPYEYEPLTKFLIKNVNKNIITINTTSNFNLDDIILGIGTTKEFYKILNLTISGTDTLITLDRDIVNKTHIVPTVSEYIRKYKEIILDYNLYDCGLSVNIFNNQNKLFNINKNLNIESLYDEFNFPLTTGYFRISNPKLNISYKLENNVVNNDVLDKVIYNINDLEIVIVDTVKSFFTFNNVEFWFNTFKDISFRKFSGSLETGVTSSTSNIPFYSMNFGDDSSYWKDLLDIGFYEADNGVDYPYLNDLNYIYSDIRIIINRTIPLTLGTQEPIEDTLGYNSDASGIINKYC